MKEYIASTLVAAMVALSFVSVFGIAPVQAATSLGLDGSASGGAYNKGSYTVTLSTSSSPDVVIAFVTTYVGSSSITVSSISSAHLVFTMRVLVSNTGNENLEEWYAISASALAGETITVTLSASGYSTASIFGISGANTASPFDVHTGLPASAKVNAGTAPRIAGISTSNANDMILSGYGTKGSVGPVVGGTGFTTIYQGAAPQVLGTEYEVVSSALPSATVGWTNNADSGAILDDAVVASTPQPPTTSTSSTASSPTTSTTTATTTSPPTTTTSTTTSSLTTSTSTPASAELALDGSAIGGGSEASSYTVTLSTSSSPDVIIAFVTTYVGSSPISVSGISSSHLTFVKRVLASNTGNENLEEWYAIASSPLSNEVITVTLGAAGYSTASIFGISGANVASPFDTNSGLPTTQTIAASTPPTCAKSDFSTSNANDIILCAYGTKGSIGGVTTTSGFTLISQVADPQVIGAEYQVTSSRSSSASIAWANNGNAGVGIADAIEASTTSSTTTTTSTTSTSSDGGYNTPVLIQGPYQAASGLADGTFTVTMANPPLVGDVLILAAGSDANGNATTISSISQAGVTWSNVVYDINGPTTDSGIWMGVVSAGAGATISINVMGGTGGFTSNIVDVVEWSGISAVDKTAVNPGIISANSDTGTTATTSQTVELWVGAIYASNDALGSSHLATQSSPTNGFTLLDGVSSGIAAGGGGNEQNSLGYLYKVVSATGTADSGTTLATSGVWSGAIATFRASMQTTTTTTSTSTSSTSA